MSKYTELIQEINTINNTNFNQKTLRNIQLLTKRLNYYYNNKQITKLEFFNIYIKYKQLIKIKSKEISKEQYKTLSKKLIKIFQQEYKKTPTDITIIDNDLTLLLNKSYNNPYKQDEIVFLNSTNYKEIPEEHSLYTFKNCYYSLFPTTKKEDFESFYDFYFPHNNEQNKPSLQILIDYINLLLKPYNNYLNKTIEYNIKEGKIIYPINSNMKVFINIPLKDIITSIYRKEIITFNLVAINEWNEIHSYKITQTPKSNKFYNWNFESIELPTWNLSETIKNNKTLTRKKVDK